MIPQSHRTLPTIRMDLVDRMVVLTEKEKVVPDSSTGQKLT
jgi:hypothetical protein